MTTWYSQTNGSGDWLVDDHLRPHCKLEGVVQAETKEEAIVLARFCKWIADNETATT